MNQSKSYPLVSIITPTYNSEKFIKETANSVINQSFSDWEWLVIDDCSLDGTREILEELAKSDIRIKPVFLKKNFGGPAKPRNEGLDRAKGIYICFLDSDDVWLENKIKNQLTNIGGYDAICSHFSVIDENSKVIKSIAPFFNQFLFSTGLYKYFIIYLNPININTVMIQNNTAIRFIENKEFTAIEDWIFWIEYLSDDNSFRFHNEVLINYRVRKDALSSWGTISSYMKIVSYLNLARKENKINLFQFITAKIAVYLKIIKRKVANII